MKRTQIYLTEVQMKKLSERAKGQGISLSELIRRVLDEYIEKKDL